MTEEQPLKGKNRSSLEKFYTKSDVVDLCMQELKTHLEIKKDDVIIEPSAGNGAFISAIQKLSDFCICLDIDPPISLISLSYSIFNPILKRDYLSYDIPEMKPSQNYHVIGNPPFGKQSKTAIQFIKKSAQFAKSISFILPKSFKKTSMKRAFPAHFHLIKEIDLPEKSFTIENVEHNVPCIFQIWQKMDYIRPATSILEPSGYIFVKRCGIPDISIRRVGVYAGKIDTETQSKNEESHYFIQFLCKTEEKKKKIEALKKATFEHNNTVGPKSISKQEFIAKYNQCFV